MTDILFSVEGMKLEFDVNFFGVINVTTAFLPYMRARRSGTVVIIGSRSGWRTLPVISIFPHSPYQTIQLTPWCIFLDFGGV
jgi:short-subunit dehydrogenase